MGEQGTENKGAPFDTSKIGMERQIKAEKNRNAAFIKLQEEFVIVKNDVEMLKSVIEKLNIPEVPIEATLESTEATPVIENAKVGEVDENPLPPITGEDGPEAIIQGVPVITPNILEEKNTVDIQDIAHCGDGIIIQPPEININAELGVPNMPPIEGMSPNEVN